MHSSQKFPASNLAVLYRELEWLGAVIENVMAAYFQQPTAEGHWTNLELPDLSSSDSAYGRLVTDWQLNVYERLGLALSLAPHLRPESLDMFFAVNTVTGRAFSEFGGFNAVSASGFLPSGQTLMFLISANDPNLRVEALALLASDHRFCREAVIACGPADPRLPRSSNLWSMSEDWVQYLLKGDKPTRTLSARLPIHPITTPLEWQDLVLMDDSLEQLTEIQDWQAHGASVMKDWGLVRHGKPGLRVLFRGEEGSGRTLSAALLGKQLGRSVYRVELAMLAHLDSDEAETRIRSLFDLAAARDWILVFPDVSAVTPVREMAFSNRQMPSNGLVVYVHQCIEDFAGLVILMGGTASNVESTRFGSVSVVDFPMPDRSARQRLWSNVLAGVPNLAANVDLEQLAADYEINGGQILKVVHRCALRLARRGSGQVTRDELSDALRQELAKRGRLA